MKRKVYICPNCKENHRMNNKHQGKGFAIVKCACGCNSIIMVKSGYYIPSELERIVHGYFSDETLIEGYLEVLERDYL